MRPYSTNFRLKEAFLQQALRGAVSEDGTNSLCRSTLYTDVMAAAWRRIVAELRARYQWFLDLLTQSLMRRIEV